MGNSTAGLLIGCYLFAWVGETVQAQGGRIVIGGSHSDEARSIIQTSDGGYAIAGYTFSYGQGGFDVYVVKLDAAGDVQWTRTIGGSGVDQAFSIIQTSDGGYAVAGWTTSYGQGNEDIYVVKLDSGGNLQWTRTVGGTNRDYGYSIIQTVDGGYAVAGKTLSYGQGGYDIYMVKLDSGGNVQWTRTVGGTGAEEATSIISTTDSGYALAGWTNSTTGNIDLYAVKLDSAGNLQWTRAVGGLESDYGRSIIQAIDGGYVVAGRTNSYGQGNNDVYVVKLDAGGGFNASSCPDTSMQVGVTGSGGDTSAGGVVDTGGGILSGGVVDSGGIADLCGSLCLIDTVVMRYGDTLMARMASAAYQWLDCDAGYAPIPGATERVFVPDTTGNYAVAISNGGCVDTSSCHQVVIVISGVWDAALASYRIRVDGLYAYVVRPEERGAGYVEILDGTGRLLIRRRYRHQREVAVPVGMLPPGVYALRVIERNAHQVFRFVRSR